MFRVVYDEHEGTKINVIHGQDTKVIRFSPHTDTFGKIAEQVAKYFGLRTDIVFISDKLEKGCIYMKDVKVRGELFPLLSVMPNGYRPTLYLKL